MQYLPVSPYPDNEKPKLTLLEDLFREWHQHFANNGSALEKHVADEMVFDGFYPHYFSQKKKILFIGREARGIAGCNYIDVLYTCYRESETNWIGKQHLNVNKVHSRMIYIAYGIMNGMPTWQEIPCASEIGKTFGAATGLSFAFMNISKLSNEGEHFASDEDAINKAYALSTEGRNFIQEQVAILEPDIVITMNLKEKIASLGKLTPVPTSGVPRSCCLESGGHRSLLIDTWHFSNWTKDDIADYYTPICDAIRRSEASL